MNLLFNLLKAKWVFTKPQNKEVLIYDNMSKTGAKFLFNKNDCEILYVRYEQINLNVLFKTIISNGLKNIKDNYKVNYMKSVSPKIVFSTFIRTQHIYACQYQAVMKGFLDCAKIITKIIQLQNLNQIIYL